MRLKMDLPFDLCVRLYALLSISDLKNYRLLSRSCKDVSFYETSLTIKVHGPLSKWAKLYPRVKHISVRSRQDIVDEDFQSLDHFETLNMEFCSHTEITSNMFQPMTNLKVLYLHGCCNHWWGMHHFDDKLFDHLTQLERFSIDDNHVITNKGFSKMTKLTYLSIHNCSNIGNDGFGTMSQMKELVLNRMQITDDVFTHMPNITRLNITGGKITCEGILKLKKIVSLRVIGTLITYEHFDTLPYLKHLDVTGSYMNDHHMQYLSNITNLSIYDCSYIHGLHFDKLENLEVLSVWKTHLDNQHILKLLSLKKLKQVNLHDCNSIRPETIRKLYPLRIVTDIR